MGPEELKYADRDGNLFIPIGLGRDTDLIKWFYQDPADAYMGLLASSQISEMPVWLPKREYCEKTERPFLRQFWVCCMKGHEGVKGDSGVSANNRSLHEKSRLIGVG